MRCVSTNSEHLELKKQLSDTGDLRLRDDLERERDHLVGAMEVKAGQIARLQRHRDTVSADSLM